MALYEGDVIERPKKNKLMEFWRSTPAPIRFALFKCVDISKQLIDLYIDSLDRAIDSFAFVFRRSWSLIVGKPLYIFNSLLYALILSINYGRDVRTRAADALFATVVYFVITPLVMTSSIWAIIYTGWLSFCGLKLATIEEVPTVLLDQKYGIHKYVRLQDVRLHYVEKGGEDKPLLLFLHGFGQFWFSWRNQILDFSDKYRTVAIDMRGFGKSDKPESVQSYELNILVRELKYLIEYLNPKQKQKCYVVAQGWGAVVLYCFLLEYADLVNAYVTLNTVPPYVIKLTIRQILYSWEEYVFMGSSYVAASYARAYFPKYLMDVYNRLGDADHVIKAYAYTYGQSGAFDDALKYYKANALIFTAYMTEGITKLPLNRMPPGLCMYGNEDFVEDTYKYAIYIPNLETLKILQAGRQMNELRSELIDKLIRRYFDNLVVRDNVISIAADLYGRTTIYPEQSTFS